LAEAMLRAARDPDLLRRLGESARPSAERLCLTPEEYAERVESLLA
jgi:hypothetical protein